MYSPVLGRFISADTIVPKPQNPQDWNRYAYTVNNPIRFNDPSGHFYDDALKEYLRNIYGKDWEKLWSSWTHDQAWMDLLHNAAGGDVLAMISGKSLQYFKFEGEGMDKLTGVKSVSDIAGTGAKDSSLLKAYDCRILQYAEAGLWAKDDNNYMRLMYHADERVGIAYKMISQDDVDAASALYAFGFYYAGKQMPSIGIKYSDGIANLYSFGIAVGEGILISRYLNAHGVSDGNFNFIIGRVDQSPGTYHGWYHGYPVEGEWLPNGEVPLPFVIPTRGGRPVIRS
jgi:hypothetical protein